MVSGLTAALIATRTIDVPGGGDFAVRGISPTDAFTIYARHTGELALWFERMRAGEVSLSLDAAPQLAGSLMSTAPRLVAEIIALGAGDDSEEAVDIATRLPISVQATALEAIAALTFTSEMPPKKLLEIVLRMAASLSGPTTSET